MSNEIVPLAPLTARDIAERYGARMVGDDRQVTCARPLASLVVGAITFASKRSAAVDRGVGATVIVRPGAARADANCYLEHDNPRLLFAQVMAEFFEPRVPPSIDRNSTISPQAKLGQGVHVGSRVVIEAGVEIGEGTKIHHGAIICSGTRIGCNCVIGPGAVLGDTGFGYERNAAGEPMRIPHFGGLQIGDRVHVGANSTIARGVLEDTMIGEQTKIGPQVNIAHNVRVGRQCLITGQSQISGSATIGDRCWLGPNCTIRKCRIGNDVTVGLGVVILTDIDDHVSVFATASHGAPESRPEPPAEAVLATSVDSQAFRQGVEVERMIRRVLDLAPDFQLRDDLGMIEVPSWDSLAHVTIVMEAQKITGIRLSLESMAAIRTIGELKAELARSAGSKA